MYGYKYQGGGRSADSSFLVSSGGSRAILGGSGAAVACQLAGITDWYTIGGVSGGSIPAVLLASGKTPGQLIRMGMDLNFREMVTLKTGFFGTLKAILLKEWAENANPRPVTGIFGTEPLGQFIDENVREWPRNFWTMAVTDKSQILFTVDGVFEYTHDGKCIQLADKPAPVGLAIRASCTIPGIITAIPFAGRYLYDGVHSPDGMCPVGVPIRYLGAKPDRLIACCLGEEFMRGVFGTIRRCWRWVWGTPPEPAWGPESKDVLAVRPELWHIHALKFNLTPDEKWLGIVIGFTAAALRLQRAGILTGDGLKKATSIMAQLGNPESLMKSCEKPGSCLALRAARAFEEHGLY